MPEFYDPTSRQQLVWEPLAPRRRVNVANLGTSGELRLGSFGTCGDPNREGYSSWRQEYLMPKLAQYGIDQGVVFNPEVPKWTPLHAPVEGYHFARDRNLAVAVTDQTAGASSIMEACFAPYSGILRGQDVSVFIEHTERSPEVTRTARMLAKLVLNATEARFPHAFTLTDSLENLVETTAVGFAKQLRTSASRGQATVEYTLPPERNDLAPAVYLSGTCGTKKPEWMHAVTGLLRHKKVPVNDSYRENWGEHEAHEELTNKLNYAVQLIAITKDTESFGALGELGARVMYGDLSGQKVGVYIETHDSAPDSATNRARTLAKVHLSYLLEDFPDLPVFMANNLNELINFGAGAWLWQRQRLRKSGHKV